MVNSDVLLNLIWTARTAINQDYNAPGSEIFIPPADTNKSYQIRFTLVTYCITMVHDRSWSNDVTLSQGTEEQNKEKGLIVTPYEQVVQVRSRGQTDQT